jgi:predicted nucleotidyltransferase
MDIARIQNLLQKLTGVTVDVQTPNALPKSFRDQVMSEALPV